VSFSSAWPLALAAKHKPDTVASHDEVDLHATPPIASAYCCTAEPAARIRQL
jgi:hypothetical protein